uniref:GPI ethanolamine phosphate transferase 1 n=1 Tax=Glossina austeni TaxID=7395 RepID=A0A1A9VDD4_GLOAU
MHSGVGNIWYIYATVFHVLLLGSIFVTYFRSPVIQGLKPQQPLPREAPAKRLVLIVADGLRAQSFFYENLSNVPNLRQLIKEQQGLLGISHTRVPTESRPGHIALIAGFYEDPSAVTRGWKENPIEFDTIFQHARRTYAWGSHDILRIFNKSSRRDVEGRLTFDAYNHELDFWGKVKSYELDKWVFSRVEDFLKRKRKILQKVDKVYFFLHLLGLDTAGHIHKPQTALFLENLFITEAGIYKIYRLFEQIFEDQKTAYILTSDHGMTDSGSHGAAQPHETETPFYMWGAGINSKSYSTTKYIKLDSNTAMPLYEIEQAQMTPLMSALLGLPPPVNNLGILPRYFLNVSDEYIARAAECNAYQLLEQYKHLLKKHKSGVLSFLLPEYEALSWPSINAIKSYLKQAHFVEDYQTVTNISYNLMEMTLEGIGYYQSYYSMPLLLATTVAMLSWTKYLFNLLNLKKMDSLESVEFKAIVAFCILQKLSWQVSLYLLLPIPVMSLALRDETQGLTPLTFGQIKINITWICAACCFTPKQSQNNKVEVLY